MAIIHPLRPRLRKSMIIIVIIAIWLASTLIAIPNMLYSTTLEVKGSEETRILCYLVWPDGTISLYGYQDYVYNVLLTALTYFLPICVMGYAYFTVGMKMWGSQGIGELTERQMENIRSKRRMVKALMMVVTIFAICWLPQNIYFIVGFHFQELNAWTHIQEIYLGMYWYNPIIYCWMSARFRDGFLQVFYWWSRYFRSSVTSNESHPNNCIALSQVERSGFVLSPQAIQTFRVDMIPITANGSSMMAVTTV